ncbi:MAG: MAPEG family protein [Methylobacterium sp.]|nr:MAPEG family protein [Methylobacterium sp.]
MNGTLAAIDANALSFAASYIAVLVLLGMALTFRVIFVRRAEKVAIGDGGSKELALRIRVHGNFCEQAPMLCVVLALLPVIGAGEWMVHVVGLTGVTGRVLHAIGFSRSAGASLGRVVGMVLTAGALVIGALSLLVLAWQ